MDPEGQAAYEPLTDREQEILHLIAEGLTNQQIADQLFLTLDTVKWYNKHTYQKLRVRSRTQAVARARAFGLLGEPSPSVKHNLPVQSALFVGREQELAAIEAQLAEPACRLLTLLGPGGIGKTRLAVEAARRQVQRYVDGIYFIPFAPVESPAFMVQALVDGLGLSITYQRDLLEQVIHFLRQKKLLVVLDNFEHLLEGVTLVGEMLTRSTTAKFLVTSRERLRLKDEWMFEVQGLRYPAGGHLGEDDTDPATHEAGQLFLWTARKAKLDFVPDEQERTQIARICQLVGGMPLAIELAASWVRVLSCAEIVHGISQDLEMLTSAWRDLPQRHRSIQAVLDRSWRLLTVDEQKAFCRLTVFSSSFRREAAAAIVGASVTMLLALVDKSFLRRTVDDRFDIHELVKQYGSEKFQADQNMPATRLQHCRYHAAFLYDRMSVQDASQYLGEIESVFEDVQTAWRYAVENRQLAEIGQLASGFLDYYRLHSWYRAGSGAAALYQRALACFDSERATSETRDTLACLYESLGYLYELASVHDAVLDAYEKVLENIVGEDPIRQGRIYGKMADIWVGMNEHEQGHEFYTLAESVLENAPRRDVAWWREWLRIQMQKMELYYWQNRPHDMAELARRIEPLLERHGSVRQRVRYLYLLGMMAARRDRYFYSSDAITYSDQALTLSLETGNLGEIAYRHFSHGFSHLWSDHLDDAEMHLLIAREMTEQNGDITLLARALTYLTVVYRKQGDRELVREYAAHSLRIALEAKMSQYSGMAHAHFAWLAWCAGDLAETQRQGQQAIEEWGGLGQAQSVVPFRWFALFPLMGVALQEDDIDKAAHWARHMLPPPQQRLPGDLTKLLEQALHCGENDQWGAAADLLRQALQLAQELHYI